MRLGVGEIAGSLWVVALVLALALERWRPARTDRPTDLANNLRAWGLTFVATFTATPLAGAAATLAVNAAGGGLIVLPATGWGLVWGLAVYLIAMDAGEYLFHRAQHAVPALWAMHSLHHSDPAVSVTTAARHFWLEAAIKSVTIYLAVGLLFRVSPTIIVLYGVLHLYNLVLHANVKMHLGPLSAVVNSPQQHRLHHSSESRHGGRNYAALLSIFDVICGTYLAPERDDFPLTGLPDRGPPADLWETLVWPLLPARAPTLVPTT